MNDQNPKFLAFLLPLLLAGLSLVGSTGAHAAASAVAVEGVDRSRSLLPAGTDVQDYRNSGYRLWRDGDEVRVVVDTAPMESDAPFLPPEGGEGDIARLAQGLTVGVESQYEAISRILGWVASTIDYRLDRQQPQDAAAVLARGSAYCTGVARLTVALMHAVGIEAREVAGYVLGGAFPGAAGGYHRWIEAYLPDRGWVFSDPLVSHHFVPATYVRLASEELQVEVPGDGLLLERSEHLNSVDLYPAAVPGVKARRNRARQLAATLRVEVEGSVTGLAILVGAGARRTHTLVAGSTTFVGLEPGTYHLRLLFPGRPTLERLVELPDRIRQVLHLPAASLGQGPGNPTGIDVSETPDDIEKQEHGGSCD